LTVSRRIRPSAVSARMSPETRSSWMWPSRVWLDPRGQASRAVEAFKRSEQVEKDLLRELLRFVRASRKLKGQMPNSFLVLFHEQSPRFVVAAFAATRQLRIR